jgi:hypothetical protein
MIQHDMLLWDHGAPRADGTIAPEQRPEADINVEFLAGTRFAAESMGLAFLFRDANERYATDYPAAVGNHMTNTDSSSRRLEKYSGGIGRDPHSEPARIPGPPPSTTPPGRTRRSGTHRTTPGSPLTGSLLRPLPPSIRGS